MRINSKVFPGLSWLQENDNPFDWIYYTDGVDEADNLARIQSRENMKIYHSYWALIRKEYESGNLTIDYATRATIEEYDNNVKTADQLWRARDMIEDSIGLYLTSAKTQYFYCIVNSTREKKVRFFVMNNVGLRLVNITIGYWEYSSGYGLFIDHIASFDIFDPFWKGQTGYHAAWPIQNVVTFLIFKHHADIKTEIVNRKRRKIKTESEKILSETDFEINIVDAYYWKTIIRTEEFEVSPHWRWQACGPGWSERKLIWINKFKKHGYTRMAKISN